MKTICPSCGNKVEEPSLIEIAYSSALEAKPKLFIPWIGMAIPQRVENWLNEEARGEQ